MEQELHLLPEHLSSSPVFSGVRVSFMCMFCRLLFVLLVIALSVLLRFTDSDYLPFVSSNSSCLFVLFLLVIVLSVLLRYTDSDYLFGIFKLILYNKTNRYFYVELLLSRTLDLLCFLWH